MAEQYIIGNNAQFNDSVEILKDLTLYGVVENSTDFAVKIQGDEKLRITSEGALIGDTISHIGDIDTKIRFPENDVISFETAGSERLRIASDGSAKFTGTNEQDIIHISTGNAAGNTFANIRGDNEAGIRIRGGGSIRGGTIELSGGLRDTDPGIIKFSTGALNGQNSERLRITSGGMLIKGHTESAGQIESQLNQQNQFHGNNRKGGIRIADFSDSQFPASLEFVKSRNATTGQNTILQDGDRMGSIFWGGANGTNFQPGAFLTAITDGTVSSTSMPTAISFGTNQGDNLVERLRIKPDGLTTLKNFNGTGLRLQGSGSDYQGMQLQVTDASASQTRNVFIDAVNETGVAVANQVGQIQSDGGSYWSWSTQPAGDRTDRREERLRITSSGNLQFNSGFGSVQTAYGVRAWALWNGVSNTLLDDGNIAGFTDHGTGTYTFTFDNNMPDSNYVITGSTGRNATPHFSLSGNTRTASGFKVATGTWGSSYSAADNDSTMFCVIC